VQSLLAIDAFGKLAKYFLKLNAVKVNHRRHRKLLSGGQGTVAALTAVVRFSVRGQG